MTPQLHGGGQERDIRSGTLDTPAVAGFAAAVELAVEHQPEHAARMAALRDDLVRRVQEQVPGATPERRPGPRRRAPAARQRPPGLPRLRGRLAADAARRARHRLLDRLGVLRRRAAGLPRAARDGPRRRAGPQLAAVLARPHQHAPPTSTRSSRRSARSSSGPAPRAWSPASARPRRRSEGARARRHVRRRRLRRRRGPRRRRRPRRHRHPPRAVAQPAVLPHAAPAAAARSRTPTTPAGPPT